MTTVSLSKRESVGVIGLGIMGSAMASHLAKAGFAVYGVDVSPVARKKMSRLLSHVDADLEGCLGACTRLITSLPSVAALDSVAERIVARERDTKRRLPLVIAETSTLPHKDKLRVRDRLATVGVVLLDCPLSGTGAQAKKRDIAVYASGEKKNIAKIKPIFEACARKVYDVGAFGNGTYMKLVANLLVAIHNVSTAEALLFGERLGLDQMQMVNVLADGAGGSRMLAVRGPVMAKRSWSDAAMKVDVWQKDMHIISEALHEARVPAPLFAATVPIYLAALAQDHALDDTAAVYAVLERLAGGAHP